MKNGENGGPRTANHHSYGGGPHSATQHFYPCSIYIYIYICIHDNSFACHLFKVIVKFLNWIPNLKSNVAEIGICYIKLKFKKLLS